MSAVTEQPQSVEPQFSSELLPERSRDARRRGLLSGGCVALAGVISTLVLYLLIRNLQSEGKSAAALAMSSMHMQNIHKFWSFPLLQASGLTGLVFAYLSVALGLQQSSRGLPRLRLSYRQIDRLHRQISLLVIALVIVHVVATALDAMGDSIKTVLIPWQWANQGWPQAVVGYTFGIMAMYILFIVAPTFYLRKRIGTSRWRFLHRFILLFYILSVTHTLILGLDISHYSWIRPVIWLAQIPLLALFIRRLTLPLRGGSRFSAARQRAIAWTRYALAGLSSAGIAAALVIVISGNSGLITNV